MGPRWLSLGGETTFRRGERSVVRCRDGSQTRKAIAIGGQPNADNHRIEGRGRRSRRTARCRAGSWAFYEFRDDGIMQVICPTCQVNFVESEVIASAGLLCMGLFSIFWLGARAGMGFGMAASRSGRAADRSVSVPVPASISGHPRQCRGLSGRMTARLWSTLC